MDSSHELFERARGGDREAFLELVEPMRSRLLAAIRLRMPRDADVGIDENDLLQETWARAIEKLPEFEWRGEGALAAWLTTIARNLVHSAHRRVRRARQDAVELDDMAQEQTTPLGRLRRAERFERLEAALRQIPDHYREMILLAVVEEVPLREIAEQTGRTPEAASMLLLRALRKLGNVFGETESLGLPNWALRITSDGADADSEA